jgi:hypothetical protein
VLVEALVAERTFAHTLVEILALLLAEVFLGNLYLFAGCICLFHLVVRQEPLLLLAGHNPEPWDRDCKVSGRGWKDNNGKIESGW